MLRIMLLVITYFSISLVTFAETISKEEFDQLRQNVRSRYATTPISALEYVEDIISTVKLSPDQKIGMLNYKAWFQLEENQFEQAVSTLVTFKRLVERTNRPDLMYGYYNISGGIYIQLNQYQLALEYFLEALKYTKEQGEIIRYQVLNNLGEVYLTLKRFDEAENIFRDYLAYISQKDKLQSLAVATINLSKTLIAKQQYDEARQLVVSLNIKLQGNNLIRYISESYTVLGEIEQAQGDYVQSLKYFDDALAISQNQSMKNGIKNIHFNLAKTYRKMEDDKNIFRQLNIISGLIDTKTNLIFSAKFYEFQADYFEFKGLYKQALLAHRKHNEAHTKLITRQANVNLAKALAEVDLYSKEAKISALIQSQQMEEVKNKEFKIRALAVALFLFFIIFGSFIALKNINNKKQKLITAIKKLRSTQSQLIEAEKMASLTSLVSGMAHQLNSPIGVIVTANSIIDENLARITDSFNNNTLNKKGFNNFIESSAEAVDLVNLSGQRLTGMVNEFKALNVSKDIEKQMLEIELKSFLHERLAILQSSFGKQLDYDVSGENVTTYTYSSILHEIVKTLIINAYEHGFEHDQQNKLSINITKEGLFARIVFQDNGKGIDEAILSNIFTPFYSTNPGGNHLGLGLNVIYNAIKHQLFGTIEAEPCLDGARFVITLPINN